MSLESRIDETVKFSAKKFARGLRAQARWISANMTEDSVIQSAINNPGATVIHDGRAISSNGKAVVIASATAPSIYPPGFRFPKRTLRTQAERDVWMASEKARLAAEKSGE